MEVSSSAPASEGTSAPAEGLSAESSSPVEQTPEEIRKHRVKVFDQELEVTEDDLKKDYELRRASHIRMQKAAETEKQYKELLKELETDPWKLFERLQLDPDEVAEKRLLKRLERDMKREQNPELFEREEALSERERKIKEFEEAKRLHDEELAKQEQEALTYKAIQEIDTEIGEVLRATGQRPTPRVVSRIAEIMLAHLDTEDGERLGADKAFGIVRNEMTDEMSEYLGSLPPEQLVQTLPKSVLDAIRKYDLDKVRGTNPIKQSAAHDRPSTHAARTKKATSTDSFFSRLEKKLK